MELNERETKERARLAKDNGTEREQTETLVPGVKQNLGSIMQKNTFVGEDVRPLEDIILEGESEDERAEEEGDDVVVDYVEVEEVAPLTWGDVFVEDGAPVSAETTASAEEEEEWAGITSFSREGA
jgi:nuclear GTP-binding protein